MPDRQKPSFDVKCYAAARLHVERNLKKSEIAAQLGVSPGTVTKWLDAGRKKGLWREGAPQKGPEFDNVPDAVRRDAEVLCNGTIVDASAVRLLAGAGDSHLRKVFIVQCNWDEWRSSAIERTGTMDDDDWRAFLATYGRQACYYVKELMKHGKTWGVTWGSHVEAVINAISAEHSSGARPRRDVTIVPLSGVRPGATLTRESSGALAEDLQRALTGRVDKPLTFGQVPAFLMGKLKAAGVLTMWLYVSNSWAYVEVMGSDRLPPEVRAGVPEAVGLVHALDGIVTSISRDGHPFGYGSMRLYENAGYRQADIEQRYQGDIGGIGLLRNGEQRLDVFESRWTGILREDLLAVAQRAASKDNLPAGVVVLAAGSDRIESVLSAVRCGYVTYLIIDQSLAQRMRARIDSRASGLKPNGK
jgi:hypothetical protein